MSDTLTPRISRLVGVATTFGASTIFRGKVIALGVFTAGASYVQVTFLGFKQQKKQC